MEEVVTNSPTLRTTSSSVTGARGVTPAVLPGTLLVGAALLALALVPDEAFLRSKVVWGEGLLLAGAAALLLGQAAHGRLLLPAPGVLLAALLPAGFAALWLWLGTPISDVLARDEIERLTLLPVAVWAAAAAAERPGARRALLAALVLTAIPVAGFAVAQNLAGILELPLNRVARPASTFGNPVFLGAYLVLVLPVALAGALFGRGVLRWGGALAAGLALPALYATQTRWAWLGGSLAAALGAVLLAPTRGARRALLVALLAVGLLLAALNRDVLQRQHAHGLIWRDTLALIADHPLGVGPGQYSVAFLPYASDELLAVYPRRERIINDAHSEPLQIVAELGWPGLLRAAFLLLQLGRAARGAWRAADPLDRPLVAGLLAGLAGLCAMSCGSPDLRFVATTMLFGCLTGLLVAFAPARSWAAGGVGRALLAAGGLALLAVAARQTHEGLQLRRLLADPASFPRAPDGASAVARLQAVVAREPQDAAARYELGVALARERRWAEAAQSVEAAFVLSAGQPGLQRSLGLMQAMAGSVDDALPNLRAALAQRPDDAEVRYLVAYLHFWKGELADALRELDILLAQHPDHALGRLLQQKLRE